ncbi:thioredoxin [Halyomorpha halys]|uniref:thioredoxin n=1 Tax=Halyomorpha halys TaxID=286706 RepID=UPI0006D4CE0A|nr:thioredoxin-like [Halyomorpha halys]
MQGRESTAQRFMSIYNNPEEFDDHLIQSGETLVIAHFHADTSGPSMKMLPKIKEMASQYPDVSFITVDVNSSEELTQRYNISTTPTFIFFKSGAKKETVIGANEEALENCMHRLKDEPSSSEQT